MLWLLRQWVWVVLVVMNVLLVHEVVNDFGTMTESHLVDWPFVINNFFVLNAIFVAGYFSGRSGRQTKDEA